MHKTGTGTIFLKTKNKCDILLVLRNKTDLSTKAAAGKSGPFTPAVNRFDIISAGCERQISTDICSNREDVYDRVTTPGVADVAKKNRNSDSYLHKMSGLIIKAFSMLLSTLRKAYRLVWPKALRARKSDTN